MLKRLFVASLLLAVPWQGQAQQPSTVLEDAAKTMGATNLKSIQYSGSGYSFALGQSVKPESPWPRFNVKSYTRVINYETVASREELVRTQGEDPPRGGGGQPLAGEQRQVLLISGTHAWNLVGNTVTPAALARNERLVQIWVSPHGVLKAAQASSATVKPQIIGGKKFSTISFVGHGKFKVNAIVNDQNLVEKVETWLANPVLGDMLVEATYSNYQDFNGVKFPTKIIQKQGGYPVLDITVNEVRPNAAADIPVPDSVRQASSAPATVQAQKVAEGIWYLSGGSHHSVAVEMKDYVILIEGPLYEERATAVIAEVKKAVPTKPLKYLVNTHHHFDHSGGIRGFAAEGATIITHQMNKPFYERAFAAPRTLGPDKLSQSKKKAKIETVTEKRILFDGSRSVELHHIQGNAHNDGILMAYLSKEKLLVEADVYTPAPPNAPPPAIANPFSVNLYENIQRLKLEVDQILPLHGRPVKMTDLQKAIGRGL